MRRKALTVFMLLSALASLSASSMAQEPIKLKLAGVVPPSHYMAVHADIFFMDKVKELTNGAVTFEYYPAQQLGKADAIMKLTQAGVADIGQQPIGYVMDRLPLSGVVGLPGLADTSCAATASYSRLSQPGGLLYESDFKPNKVRAVFSVLLPQYSVITSAKKIAVPADFAGLKLRVDGGVMEMSANTLGAIPIQLASPDVYQSLSRGTIDGVFFALLSAKPYKLQTTSKYAVRGFSFGTAGVNWLISDAVWDKLSPQVQQAMTSAGRMAEKQFCDYADANEDGEADVLAKVGVTITTFSPEARRELKNALQPVIEKWAKDQDNRGKPGSAVLKAYTDGVEALQKK